MKLTSNKLYANAILAAILSLILISPAKSESIIQQTIEENKIDAEAEYFQGSSDKPAVLILHGFLTTSKFHTIVSMAKALNQEGYSVLTPTLTLNIVKRKSSVKCNSVHTHTLENDVKEIHDWVNWLTQKGHKKIILIGHSSGSLELLEYLNTYEDPPISSVIFTSIFYAAGEELGISSKDIELAQDLISRNDNKLNKYSFLFCKNNYLASPKSFLSYLKLDRNYVLESMRNLKLPNYSIMGSADKRYQAVGDGWISALEMTGTNMVIIKGANHFFSSEHEFDLQDKIISIVSSNHE